METGDNEKVGRAGQLSFCNTDLNVILLSMILPYLGSLWDLLRNGQEVNSSILVFRHYKHALALYTGELLRLQVEDEDELSPFELFRAVLIGYARYYRPPLDSKVNVELYQLFSAPQLLGLPHETDTEIKLPEVIYIVELHWNHRVSFWQGKA